MHAAEAVRTCALFDGCHVKSGLDVSCADKRLHRISAIPGRTASVDWSRSVLRECSSSI